MQERSRLPPTAHVPFQNGPQVATWPAWFRIFTAEVQPPSARSKQKASLMPHSLESKRAATRERWQPRSLSTSASTFAYLASRVDQTNLGSTLPLPLIQEAHRIEKMAKNIQRRMKG